MTTKIKKPEEQLVELFIKTFKSPEKAIERVFDINRLTLCYHKNKHSAMDVAYATQIVMDKMLMPWLNKKLSGNRSTSEANQLLAEVFYVIGWDTVNKAGVYMFKSITDYANENSLSEKYLNEISGTADFFIEVAKIMHDAESKSKLQSN
ncbi:MAG: hypothetical protein ACTHMM_11940 [Agriterribacter sp.]